MASPIATHEAAHTAVARHLGLVVREVRVQEGKTMPVPRYCAELYGLPEGMEVPAVGCMLEDDCLQKNTEQVLVAMVAPSWVKTGDAYIDAYGAMEAMLACVYADDHGLDRESLLVRAKQCAHDCRDRITEIAERLDKEGVIDGGSL